METYLSFYLFYTITTVFSGFGFVFFASPFYQNLFLLAFVYGAIHSFAVLTKKRFPKFVWLQNGTTNALLSLVIIGIFFATLTFGEIKGLTKTADFHGQNVGHPKYGYKTWIQFLWFLSIIHLEIALASIYQSRKLENKWNLLSIVSLVALAAFQLLYWHFKPSGVFMG